MPLNKFEVLRDRVMQRGEGSRKEIGKERREILKEERKKKIVQVQIPGKDKKEKKKGVDEKKKEIKEEREVEMQGFSRGEILKGRYPLAWWKVQCYEYGGLGHRKRDYGETKKIEEDKKKDKKEIKKKKSKKKKIKRRKIGIETERGIVEEKREKRDAEIATEKEIVIKEIVEDKKEIELREQEERRKYERWKEKSEKSLKKRQKKKRKR